MNIYESKKLADEWHVIWDTNKFPKGMKRTVEEMDRRKIADFDFNKHCRKHFMDALEFIKRRITDRQICIMREEYPNTNCGCEICEANELITKLEDVKE